MKPDWDTAPEWAMYIAMDGDGMWHWWKERPAWDEASEQWEVDLMPSQCYELASDAPDESGIDWDHAFDTLEQRP